MTRIDAQAYPIMKQLVRRGWPVLVVATLVISTLACAWAQSIIDPGADQGSSETLTGDVEFGSGPFNLQDTTAGLAALSSYKATLTLAFQGSKAGQPTQWSKTYVMLAAKDPTIRRLTMASSGDLPNLTPVLMVEADGVTYDIRADNSCVAEMTAAGNTLADTMEPAGFLSGVIGADPAGNETIGGRAAERYTFDERALGEAGFTKSAGQLWVASDTGVVMRYILTTTAGPEYFGEGMEGTLTWQYELTDINEPVPAVLPPGCPQLLLDPPIMPGGEGVRRLPGVTTFSAPGGIQDVISFYQEQLPKLGWELVGKPLAADALGVATFAQGEKRLSVIVRPAGARSAVSITLGTGTGPESAP